MIGINNFRSLVFRDKQHLVEHEGELIAKYHFMDVFYELYALNGFFVELVKNEDSVKAMDINSFLISNKIYKYLDTIEVPELR